jgi:hypothetical protein
MCPMSDPKAGKLFAPNQAMPMGFQVLGRNAHKVQPDHQKDDYFRPPEILQRSPGSLKREGLHQLVHDYLAFGLPSL